MFGKRVLDPDMVRRVDYTFTVDQIKEILLNKLEQMGQEVPSGDVEISGIEWSKYGAGGVHLSIRHKVGEQPPTS